MYLLNNRLQRNETVKSWQVIAIEHLEKNSQVEIFFHMELNLSLEELEKLIVFHVRPNIVVSGFGDVEQN